MIRVILECCNFLLIYFRATTLMKIIYNFNNKFRIISLTYFKTKKCIQRCNITYKLTGICLCNKIIEIISWDFLSNTLREVIYLSSMVHSEI